jgi:choline kinase
MVGLVLAAGPGRRLHALTSELPKTLLTVADDRTILELAVANLRTVGLKEIVIVTGFAAGKVEERVPELERRLGVRLRLVLNERAEEWNNAYSLWLARDTFAEGALLVNGDTVHPASVESALVGAGRGDVALAVDTDKPLGDEEMKTLVSPDGALRRISKEIPAAEAHGEYVGVALIAPAAAGALADALEVVWRRDPGLYYEDGFQELVDRGGRVEVVPIGPTEWVEVDDAADLERAREIACRY